MSDATDNNGECAICKRVLELIDKNGKGLTYDKCRVCDKTCCHLCMDEPILNTTCVQNKRICLPCSNTEEDKSGNSDEERSDYDEDDSANLKSQIMRIMTEQLGLKAEIVKVGFIAFSFLCLFRFVIMLVCCLFCLRVLCCVHYFMLFCGVSYCLY